MTLLKALFSVAITLLLIYILQTKFGDVPPLGEFLNPGTGFWQNAESETHPVEESLVISGLQNKVIVRYDEHMIPHIFAKSDYDLYYAQGFITARDRLWQMDIQSRNAAGRLSEILGIQGLEIDRYHRRMGMTFGAENTLRRIMKNPATKMAVEAYSNGVNSYIHQLKKSNFPIEFKILDYAPEEWKPINCVYLLKLMSETLAGGSDQFPMTNNLKRFGAKTVQELFPDYTFYQDPIVPVGTQWNFKTLPIPKPSKDFIAQMVDTVRPREHVVGIGSNNWAIAGSKSESRYPILANDPHLNLTFPSIWYEIQLSSPSVNVYGVSLPGAPCVIIGYNQKISWGVTNVDADVLDWYQIRFKDKSKNEYWYNHSWNKVKKRVEIIKIRGSQPLQDTVIYTHHGPVVYDNSAQKPKDRENVPVGDALRWVAHDESNEFMTFYLLNRAKNYEDYRKALTCYSAPAQNFIFAGIDNDIAITSNGKIPLKYKDQGKFIMDGSDTANDWHGWIPYNQLPSIKNPSRGFVSSANQNPTDSSYPYYINWRFGPYDRGKRINTLLNLMKGANVDSMRKLQLDDYSMRAHDVLPSFFKYLDSTKLNKFQLQLFRIVRKWDMHFSENSTGASIFNYWWFKFYNMTWSDKFDDKKVSLSYPSPERTEQLLIENPNSKWFDNTNTNVTETAAEIVQRSFVEATNDMLSNYGRLGKQWEWGEIKNTHINHLANLNGFGSGQFASPGAAGVVNALKSSSGPSWRMVVQMGPVVKGYGIFPGGESGNPGSHYYDDMFETWKNGQLQELLFLKTEDEKSKKIKSTLSLIPNVAGVGN